jgi:hypothetical protein
MEIPGLVLDVAVGMVGTLFGSSRTFTPDQDIPSLEGKVVFVTGGMNISANSQVRRVLISYSKATMV